MTANVPRREKVAIVALTSGICVVLLFWAIAGHHLPGVFSPNRTTATGCTVDGEDGDLSIVLGRPAERAITLSVMTRSASSVTVVYGTSSTRLDRRSETVSLSPGIPGEIALSGLTADTPYTYRVDCGNQGNGAIGHSMELGFHTARAQSSAFTFAVEADPHLDEQSDSAVYRQTLSNVRYGRPDFLVDLGDTFMTDKLEDRSEQAVIARYRLLRSYFDDVSGAVPLFLALGNHDGEGGYDSSPGYDSSSGGANNLATLSVQNRHKYFPNPAPDDFYSGSPIQADGQPAADYYSFRWGTARFIVLDPYRYTTTKPGDDGWQWTLGKEQYDWLRTTLENSQEPLKFLFIHQLVGGDNQGRGGVEFARNYEWGGCDLAGNYAFDAKRPGWGKPIHQLLVDNHVNIVFKGHDHVFVKQDLDGVVYQTLPQPSHPGDSSDIAGKYGYRSGDIVGGSGHLQITVVNSTATVVFVRANQQRESGFSYDVGPRG